MRLRGVIDFKTEQQRMDYLANLIEEGSEDPVIREFTLKLLNAAGCKSYDYMCEVRTIHDWVRDNITYRRHVLCRDSFTTAKRVLELRSGDCDNMVVLEGAMLVSVGIPVGMRIMSSKPDKPYHHIYLIVGVPPHNPKRWIPSDPTNKSAPLGWEPNYVKKRDFLVVCRG